jgi:hypothetical protein
MILRVFGHRLFDPIIVFELWCVRRDAEFAM